MSKNSSARFSSDGDPDSNIAEVKPNARSRSSSYRNRKDLEGGPFGDSPSDRTEQVYKNCLFYMIQENEDSTNTSDRSEQNQDLYSLRNDYLEKLNIVRRRLNLIEIDDERSTDRRESCTITEILEVEQPKQKTVRNMTRNLEKQPSGSSGDLTESFEIKTIHPFSVCYNMNSQSINNLLELEYNPPKKKSCFRLKTPKLPSSSESNIPYHTKVSIHEDIFKKSNNVEPRDTTDKIVFKNYHEKFTVTKWTQCSDQENEKTVEKSEYSENVNLFPTVIVRTNSPSVASIKSSPIPDRMEQNETEVPYPLNFIEDASVESYNTVTTSTTILDNRRVGKKRKRFSIRNKNSQEKMDIQKKYRSGHSEGENFEKSSNYQRQQIKHDIIQFLTYRKEKRRAKSSPIRRKNAVPFGPIVINDYEKKQHMNQKFYLFNSSSFSDEERYVRGIYEGTFDSDSISQRKKTFWSSLISCFRPIFDFIKRR
nr:uncharacterized protein LOC111509564 isoform X1 [Leptinotarsa decemlineata]